MNLTIISGGQTGADRAALAWARRHAIPHDGWCPRDRWSESGRIPHFYRLRETPSRSIEERTLWNVRDSDGTAILGLREKLAGGTALTARFCVELERPFVFLCGTIWTPREAGLALRHFVRTRRVHRLNIAGPRASEEPGVEKFTQDLLGWAFAAELPAGVPGKSRRKSPGPR